MNWMHSRDAGKSRKQIIPPDPRQPFGFNFKSGDTVQWPRHCGNGHTRKGVVIGFDTKKNEAIIRLIRSKKKPKEVRVCLAASRKFTVLSTQP